MFRERVRRAIHHVDRLNTALQWNFHILRRTYSVPGPNSLWHIDGNHKLIKWKFVIHGGIDGYTRMIVHFKCNNNNCARTVLQNFMQATTAHFVPSRVRCDYGGENIEVAKFMLATRGFNRGSILTGSSVHNQRIERLWRDVFQRVTGTFYKLFSEMEEIDILNPLNIVHIYCLHYIFLPRIQNALDMFMSAWNHHPISGEKIYLLYNYLLKGTHKLLQNGKVAEDFFAIIDVEEYGTVIIIVIDLET
uniref:Integrase core domain-containing protein n=1 Tax=Amphimedon queenslandica TaxID=400682 RepID=A0A1X7VRJ2_AMPQE